MLSSINDWKSVDTVLLDMDGTLLDLYFDNYFWMTYLPQKYAEQEGLSFDNAFSILMSKSKEKKDR